MLGSKSAKCITPILALCFLFGCNDNSTDISSMFQVEQPKPVSNSNQGAQPKPVSNSTQGTPTTQASQAALSEAQIKAKLTTTFHLLPDDANYVIKYHHDVALQVVKTANPVLTGIDFTFGKKSVVCPDPKKCQYSGAVDWDAETKGNVQRMLGQIIFVLNTPKFKERFENAGLYRMEQARFNGGYGDAKVKPQSYRQFKDVINDAIKDWKADGKTDNDQYHLYLYATTNGGDAFGAIYSPDVKLSLSGMRTIKAGTNNTYLLHDSASLLVHELMHTIGYQHDKVTIATPDNVPYYVQAITWAGGMNATECQIFMDCLKTIGNQVMPGTNYVWHLDLDPKVDTAPQNDPTFKNTNIFAMYFGSSNISARKN